MKAPSSWHPLSVESAGKVIDMTSGQKGAVWETIGHEQLSGAADLYARLSTNHIAWLCDEVGLGKTYVAMAVAALVRRQHPDARILYLLPTSRLLPKWTRELALFSRRNVRTFDHQLKTLQQRPARPLVPVQNLHELALEATLEPDRDFLCTLGAFSFALSEHVHTWEREWNKLLQLLPPDKRAGLRWKDIRPMEDHAVDDDLTPETRDARRAAWRGVAKLRVKVAVAEVINRILPDFDLVVCDESHNLRDGLGSGSSRNRLLSVSLGGVFCKSDLHPSERLLAPVVPNDPNPKHPLHALRRRARRVLLLTATPFRTEFAEMTRQAEVFGFVAQGTNSPPAIVTELQKLAPKHTRQRLSAEQVVDLRNTAGKFILRRLGTLRVNGEIRSRNQYRREFRYGGMDARNPVGELPAPSPRERLLLALVQKRVLDVLKPKDSSSGWRFQMGLLSSFESFGQTLDHADDKTKRPSHEGETSEEGSSVAKREAHALDQLISSYQATFGSRMPHPKLEHVAKAIATDAWVHGEKCLVFVRRVRTTEELATRITWHYDDCLRDWVWEELPAHLRELWDEVTAEFDGYRRALRLPGEERGTSARSLFGWYFRHHDADKASKYEARGGAVQREGLSSQYPWVVLLEDNPVLVLFEHDEARLRAWADSVAEELRQGCLNYAFIDQKDGSLVDRRPATAAAWFASLQAAALDLMADDATFTDQQRRLARLLRALRFPVKRRPDVLPESSYHGSPADWLALPTFFSELQRPERDRLLREIWGTYATDNESAETNSLTLRNLLQMPKPEDLPSIILERDQRQAVAAQLLRSGKAYLDLWLSFVQVQDSLEYKNPSTPKRGTVEADRYIAEVIQPRLASLCARLLERVRGGRHEGDLDRLVDGHGRRLTTWLELARVSRHFELMRTLNFPALHDANPDRGRDILRTTLTGLEPAIALHGSSKTERALEQFRMPGFPLVMVATSVVQEGVDLHTFCRKVVHYGIAGSATGTEQRNGRVDRRGSLVSRLLVHDPEQSIDLYFPHLRQSLEPIQMLALYEKMNRFLLMANDLTAAQVPDSQDVLDALESQLDQPPAYPKPYTELLKTAFPAVPPQGCQPLKPLTEHLVEPELDTLGNELPGITLSELVREGANRRWRTTATLQGVGEQGGDRIQPLVLELDSGLDHNRVTLVVESPVWPFQVEGYKQDKRAQAKASHAALSEVLQSWKRPSGMHLLTRRRSRRAINLWLRSEVPLPAGPLDAHAVARWVCEVARSADALEIALGRAQSRVLMAQGWSAQQVAGQTSNDHTKDEFA